MKRLLILVASLVVGACSSVVPTPPRIATPSATPQPTLVPSVTAARWRVDVVNGPRRVIVSIATDRRADMWFVGPGERVTLFDWPEARPGGIELIEMTEENCVLLDSASFQAANFTITLNGTATGPYTISLVPGATMTDLPAAEATTSCSG